MKTLNCLKLVQRLPFLQPNAFYKFQSHPILQVKRALEAFKKNKDTSTPPEDKEDPEANVEFEVNRLRKIREAIENDKSFENAAEKQKETFKHLNQEDSPFNEKKFKEKDAEFTKFFNENISTFFEKPKIQRDFRNHELDIIKQYSIKKVQPKDQFSIISGLLAYNVGMTGFWDKHGVYFPVTVLNVDRCQVLQTRETEDKKNVYLQLGIGEKSLKKTTKSLTGHFVKAGTPPKKDIRQFKVSKENALPVGYMLGVRHFLPGQFVDVQAVSKGKGTQGVMFKWGFSGGFKTHGASVSHRSAVQLT
jgi:50S ribosomal protein uL3